MTNEGHYHAAGGKAKYRRKAYKLKVAEMDSVPKGKAGGGESGNTEYVPVLNQTAPPRPDSASEQKALAAIREKVEALESGTWWRFRQKDDIRLLVSREEVLEIIRLIKQPAPAEDDPVRAEEESLLKHVPRWLRVPTTTRSHSFPSCRRKARKGTEGW